MARPKRKVGMIKRYEYKLNQLGLPTQIRLSPTLRAQIATACGTQSCSMNDVITHALVRLFEQEPDLLVEQPPAKPIDAAVTASA